MLLVAQQSTGAVLDTPTSVGAVVLVCALVGAAGLLALRRSTAPSRVRPGAATMDLRPEPPAVVDLLVGGFEVDSDAVPATVVDLAARGWFAIEHAGGDRVLIRLRSRRPDDVLTAFEQRVLGHVERHQVDGVVPAAVLTLGPEGVSQRWFRSFVREVTAHGRELGLCRRRWDLRHVAMAWGLVALAVVPAWIAGSGAPRTTDPAGWGTPGNLLLGLGALAAVGCVWFAQRLTRRDAQVDTPAGAEAAAHWLGVRDFFRSQGQFVDQPAAAVAIWDRNLAYATAMGLTPVVERQLPFDTEPDRQAWSLASGQWRKVRISYRAPRPSWGEPPLSVALAGLVQALVTGGLAVGAFLVAGADAELDQLSADQRRVVGLVALVVAVVAAGGFVFAVARLVLGSSDLFARRTVEGELVRVRALAQGHRLPKVVQWLWFSSRDSSGQQRTRARRIRYHLAVDPGDVDRIRAYTVSRAVHAQVRQGSRVRLTVSPRLGHVSAVETLAPPRASAVDDPAVVHPLVAEAVDRAASAVTGRLAAGGGVAGAMAQLEGATDEHGNPVLDQPDADGVTPRQRLATGQGELDRLRSDPRVASNPLLGSLLGALAGERDEPGAPPSPPPAPTVEPGPG